MKPMYKRIALAIAVLAIIIAIRLSGIDDYFTLDAIRAKREYLSYLVDNYYFFSVCVYIAICASLIAFSIPASPVMTVAGGYFFSAIPGALYSMCGATLGAVCSFLFYRYLFHDAAQKKYGDRLQKFSKAFEEQGAYYLLFLQLMPVTPFGIICVIAGLSTISLWTFVWTTLVGIAPGSFIYAFAGKQLIHINNMQDILSWPVIVAFILLACFSLLPVLIQHIKKLRT